MSASIYDLSAELQQAEGCVIRAAIHVGDAIRAANAMKRDASHLLMLHEALRLTAEVLAEAGSAENPRRPVLAVVPDLEDQERACEACPWPNVRSCAGCSEVTR